MTQQEEPQTFDWGPAGAMDRKALLQFVCDRLLEHPRFDWVGIYWLKDDNLELEAWKGPQATDSTTIPVDQGVCGAAIRSAATQNVPDVNKDPRYIACFVTTRSELVVPIKRSDGTAAAEIDIDSNTLGPFTPVQVGYVEAVAAGLTRRLFEAGG